MAEPTRVIIREVEEEEARSYLAKGHCAPPRYVACDAHRPECAHYIGDTVFLIPTGGDRIEWALDSVESVSRKYGIELVGIPSEAIDA
jgi:hypothetical protein